MIDKVVNQGGQANLDICKKQEFKIFEDREVIEVVKNDNRYKKEDVINAIDELNKFLKDDNTYAEYSVHKDFGDIMIKIIDSNTKEVLMECPPEKILDLVAKMCKMAGVVVDKKA
ncbi:flagellar protein FlaG [Clostridium chauvoei]|uniref:Flagellar protein FlaG n=2 Tax=Clostridium chauvoei TaxID=46867 RepID=A0ABD4RIK0_9CLOT|nr:flagellar protein FlaG [Clostridium chauvoei]ATD54620.1 hypothetical protein BTM20_04970 [Clostridium chauvoei]ATD57699.1 hypothetical protein BTM21_08090 [Clostridium chauvoei]MBX7281032.1 flagellar protein FlaG [Clostridium chauvoei]MBX7283467.1 flagellar protein FlaG [Clostridium chauvoei]MBX7286121.1 flagellar protein FlaG [Clostridium chauvoei]